MRELIRCWQHTRIIVLIALSAALYVALLIPFKLAVVVPGITEIRPAASLPIVFSIFFGPAAAWGSAFGNLIGDFFGTIGPGSLFGFLGNFLYGFAPYRIVRIYLKPTESLFSAKGWLVFLFSVFVASGLCATTISLGVDLLKIVPFGFLVHTIFLNNVLVSILLAPFLIRLLEKRIQQMQLGFAQILDPQEISTSPFKKAGPVLVSMLLLFIYAAMMFPGVMEMVPFLQHPDVFELGACIVIPVAALLFL